MTRKPKFQVGDIVQVTASGVQGEVVSVDAEADIYTVRFRDFTGSYTRPMLKIILPALSNPA